MIHRILLTALYGDTPLEEMSYYCARDIGGKTFYCDAAIPAEAGCKYILSNYPIDEIFALGTEESYNPGEEMPVALRNSEKAFPSDLEKVSEYSVLKYRLTQFIDDISVEDADNNSLLSEEEQKKTIEFLRRFFRERIDIDGDKRLNRYFHYLIQDSGLRAKFGEELSKWVPEPEENLERYRAWILQYLYRKLKATSKLELLDCNESVRIRFYPVAEGDIIAFLNHLLTILHGMECDDGIDDTIELYICLQNDRVFDIFGLINAMNLTKVLPEERIRICRVITETKERKLPIRELWDKTDEYNISELLSGTGAFLRYGKTDLLVEYWEKANLENPVIDKIIYAMRNIDTGISLCDITDIERGIKSLRSVITNDMPIKGDAVIERYFGIVMESIRRDYGPLLEEEQISFIDLAKWAYRKGFWQQTLTLIESRAPRSIVEKGIYFYSDGVKTRKHAIEVLGQIYYDLKPFEKYKLDDVSHYFVKYYGRNRVQRSSEGDAYQLNYAGVRIEDLDTRDENVIRAHTVCPDREALKELLFAYYHLSDVRNITNHAAEEFGGFYTITPDTDPGERVKMITKAVDYFIHCYDTVCKLVEGTTPNVVTVKTSEIADEAKAIRDGKRREKSDPAGAEKTT